MSLPSSKAMGLFHPRVLQKLKIHQPLPLNQRESQQLLNALTDSFRQQLDKAHGFHPEREAAPSHPGSPKRPRRRSDSSFRPTDTHIRTVLTNPLFNAPAASSTLTGTRDPMEVFEHAVSKGMMTIGHAAGCLKEKKRRIIQSSVLSVREGIRESGAGHKVLQWLISSGTANNNQFLNNRVFTTILMEFLVAEGLQEHVWVWIRRAFQERISGVSTNENISPLLSLLEQEASGPQSLDAAIFSLFRAAELLEGQPLALGRELLGNPGHRLVIEIHQEHQPMSEKAFDFLKTVIPVFSKRAEPLLAQLNLYHPSRPSADLALLYLAKMDTTKTNQHSTLVKSVHERLFVQLGLSTAKFLLEHNQGDDAAWVLDHLQKYFAENLGIANKKEVERAKSEASSLQLLEGLSFV